MTNCVLIVPGVLYCMYFCHIYPMSTVTRSFTVYPMYPMYSIYLLYPTYYILYVPYLHYVPYSK